MTDTNTHAADPAPAPDPAKATPGEYLRRLREEKGHTHAVVGNALHLTVHYIKALESDEYGKLPGLTFVKGYLRAYARFLGGDVDRVLTLFDQHIAGLLDAGKHTARVERSKRRQDQALRWGVGAGFVVVAGLVAGWWFMSDRNAAVDTVARNTPVQQTPAPVTRAAQVTAATPRVTTPFVPPAAAPASNAGMVNSFATTTPPAASDTTAPVSALTSATDTPMPATDATTPASAIGTTTPTPAIGTNTPMPVTVTTTPATTDIAPAANAAADTSAVTEADAAPTASTTVTPAANGARQVSLVGTGDDELRVTFNGSSWIEVDDGSQVRIYQDMLAAGDTLTIRGEAPFHVLLGAAANVEVSLNAAAVDFSADIRNDNTARLVLGAPATGEVPL